MTQLTLEMRLRGLPLGLLLAVSAQRTPIHCFSLRLTSLDQKMESCEGFREATERQKPRVNKQPKEQIGVKYITLLLLSVVFTLD
jgi:hypothetical protein